MLIDICFYKVTRRNEKWWKPKVTKSEPFSLRAPKRWRVMAHTSVRGSPPAGRSRRQFSNRIAFFIADDKTRRWRCLCKTMKRYEEIVKQKTLCIYIYIYGVKKNENKNQYECHVGRDGGGSVRGMKK